MVQPSTTLFNDMLSKVKTLPSYTGGTVIFAYYYWGMLFFIYTNMNFLYFNLIDLRTIGYFPAFTGDQGFLNSYYSGFPNAHVFEPDLSPDILDSRPVPEMERLSTLYNADVGLYMLANKVLEYR